MKGILNVLKKASISNTSSSIPTTDHAAGSSTQSTTSIPINANTSSSQTQLNASPKASPLASPVAQTITSPLSLNSSTSLPPSNSIPPQLISIDRKYVRNVVDEWTNWSATIFDHNKQVTQLIEHFLSSFDGWQSRDVPNEVMKCESILRTISIETATSQREYEPILSVSQEKLKSMIESTRATIEKGKERAIAQRNLMIASEQFLQKERVRLNAELQADWKRNQEIFRQNQAELYAKFNVSPNQKSSQLLESSQPIEVSSVLKSATSVELVETPSSLAERQSVSSESSPIIDDSQIAEQVTSSDSLTNLNISTSEAPISTETDPSTLHAPETTTSNDHLNTDIDSRIASLEESSPTSSTT
jgi:hypothetical protein